MEKNANDEEEHVAIVEMPQREEGRGGDGDDMTPLASSSQRHAEHGGTTGATWDVLFDIRQEIGLTTSDTSHEISFDAPPKVFGTKPGSQAETLDIGLGRNDRDVYVIAVGANSTPDINAVMSEIKRCRNSVSRSVIITFGHEPVKHLPLPKPIWKMLLCLTRCISEPSKNDILTGSNGKFLGLWRPATSCSAMCCFVFCCRSKLRLETAVCVLALIQMLKAVLVFLEELDSHLYEKYYGMAEEMVDFGLALYVIKGVQTHNPSPITHFAFVQLILGLESLFGGCIILVYWVFGAGLHASPFVDGIITFAFKLYYCWVSWSLAEEYRSKQNATNNMSGEGLV